MHRCGPRELRLADLRQVPRGVIGGLIVELAEPVRAGRYQESWKRDVDLWGAVGDGLRAAVKGRMPRTSVERLPSWLLPALKVRLRDHETNRLGGDNFVVIRMLELLGLADFEPDDDYVLSMLTGLVSAWSRIGSIQGEPVWWFRQDPGLIERAYWRAYEIEGQGVVSLRIGTSQGSTSNWRTATKKMIEQGMIARSRVIEACLAALDRDFSSAASQWFVDMLNDLDLTSEELAALQPALRRQLQHHAPGVVKNALTWLKRLDQDGLLDDESTAPALEAALLAPTKVTAMAGLRLLSRIQTRTSSADVVTAARAGLSHRHTDVQRAAARLMIAAGASDQLLADADLLEPSVRRELGIQPGSPPPGSGSHDECGDVRETTDGNGRDAPRPPATQRDVAERLAALLEHADDPFELELVLDRLAQLGRTELLRPLAKRAQTIVTANVFHRLEQQLAALVLASIGSPVSPTVPSSPWARFLHRRLSDVERSLNGTDAPGFRLATPTDPGGWLDPVEFVHRARQVDLTARRTDLIAALLRLGPTGRGEALRLWEKIASAVDPQLDQVVLYALGGVFAPDIKLSDRALGDSVLSDRALWVGASRARSPLADDPFLIEDGLGGAGQGRALDPTVSLVANPRWRPSRRDDEDELHLLVTYAHACTPASFSASGRDSWWTRKKPWDIDQPSASADVSSVWESFEWLDNIWLSWHGLIWPADAEHYAGVVVAPMYIARHWTTPDSTTRDALAGLRRHPGRFGPTAATTVALAMTNGTVEGRVHAGDAVVDLVSRQRISMDDLAAALERTAPVAILSRWANTLQHVAAAGRPEIVIRLLSRVLPLLPRDQHGLHSLLDLLHQEALRTNIAVDEPALRTYLSQFSGSSKAARSARAILAL